jgi:hypothetical protein
MSHNTLLVDDGGDGLAYPPNQGRWGTASFTSRYVDAGTHVAVRGEFGDSYRPCPSSGRHPTVERAVRDLVYVRPALIALYDRVRVTRERFGVLWTAHGARPPLLGPSGFNVENNASRADVTFLVPAHARVTTQREPTSGGNGPWFNNEPSDRGSIRVTVASPVGTRTRTFLTFIYVGARSQTPPRVVRLTKAAGVDGGVVRERSSRRETVVAFVRDDAKGRARLEVPRASVNVVANLTPGASYAVTAVDRGERCVVTIAPAPDARSGRLATASGTLAYAFDRCNVVDE